MATRPRSVIPLLAAVSLAACAAMLPTRLYTLDPAEPPNAARVGRVSVVGLGPVTLAAYLDRPEIVTRVGEHQVRPGEFDRWAGQLEPMFSKALADRLRGTTGVRDVVLMPARDGASPRDAVAVDVARFDADEGGRIVLEADWRVYRVEGGRTGASGHEVIREQGSPPPDYAAVVAAMARAVDELAGRIAPAIRGLEAERSRAGQREVQAGRREG